ncbi:MAG: copper chaperone [halophilic archaeon J07HX64]|jgi:Copper chaperone|nr:MAG: copper chaperone [halophilic archaeon J07HX64]
MACGGCEQTVEDVLAALDGVTAVEADHERDAVELLTESASEEQIRTAVEDAGYEVTA